MSNAVVCLSGGMVSVTALYYARKELELDPVGVSFAYGSKHNKKEREAAIEVCKVLDIPFYTYDLPTEARVLGIGYNSSVPFLQSDLLQSGGDIPEGHYAEESMKATVVPFRNGIMLSLAVGFAESRGIDTIILGNHFGDHAVYPDCRKSFIESFSLAAWEGTYNKMQILSPFVDWSKTDIACWGMANGVPYEKTWTCYKGMDRPCLKCGTCIERTEAFLEIDQQDPLLSAEEWELAQKLYHEVEKP